MARRYVRDNRGRFASVGATARGGRLKTAAGNKRATVTGRQEGVQPKNTISAKRTAKPSAQKPAGQPRLTPREKARRLGARPERMNESPGKRVTSIPAGTIGTTVRGRGLAKVDKAFAGVPKEQAKSAVADVFRGGGMMASVTRTQARRAIIQGSALNRVSGVRARNVWVTAPTGEAAAFQRASRASLRKARSNHRLPAAKPAAAKPAAKRRAKSEGQVLQQADRVMGKLAKRQAAVQADKVGLNEGLRQVRRNNARAGRVNRALASRGLLDKYQKLTAPADYIHMTPAGPGIKPAASRRKPTGQISEAKAGRIVARMDANRPGRRIASGSPRKNANAVKTHERAVAFALAAGARARKKGQSLSVNQSLQRAVKNASKKKR